MRVREYFDSLASDFDDRASKLGGAPWVEWAWRIAAEEVGEASGCFIVDLGAGTGLTILKLLRFTRGARFLGIDFSEEMIRKARQKDFGDAAVELRVMRIDQVDLPALSVDYFVSYGTFHHIRNKARVIKNLSRMLRSGGKFVNIDLFRPGERYVAEMTQLRWSNPEATAENDRKVQEFQWIYDRVRSHPREFHTDPYEFKQLLEDAGMRPARVHVSLQPGFAVVVGHKAQGGSPRNGGPGSNIVRCS